MKLSLLRQVSKYQLETNDMHDIRTVAKDIMARDLAVEILKHVKIKEIKNNGGLDLRVDFHILTEYEHFQIHDLVSHTQELQHKLQQSILKI